MPLGFWDETVAAALHVMAGFGTFVVPILIVTLIIRRKLQKRRYYSQTEEPLPIEGTLEELNAVDPNASPWPQDQRRRLHDTKDLVGRFHTLDGYSDTYVEDVMKRLRERGIACETLFQETLPMGVAAAIVNRVGSFELYADRARLDEAIRIIGDFRGDFRGD